MKYNVFEGSYPFNQKLGVVDAVDAIVALDIGLTIYGGHCVVAPITNEAQHVCAYTDEECI